MKKQELLKLRTLTATSKMMQMAKADKLERRTYRNWGYSWTHEAYKVGLYMRCIVQDNLLKVAIFLTEHMRAGGRLPAYELFISREKERFITYDRLDDRWLTGKLDRLPWPDYVQYSEKKWISATGHNAIKRYLGGEHGGYRGLLDYQMKLRAEALKRRHKRETDPWDLDLLQVPEVPRDWARWVSKVGIRDNYIFYQYQKKGAASGYCTYCEREVPIKNPRHNKHGRCRCCGHEITFKAAGKAGTVRTNEFWMYLLQRCEDGLVVRTFTGSRIYRKGKYQTPECIATEVRWAIYDKSGLNPRAYWWGTYKLHETRWVPASQCSPIYAYGRHEGKVYGKTLPDLARKELRATGLVEMARDADVFDPERHLAVYQMVPALEKIMKAGLPRLLEECFVDCAQVGKRILNWNASSLTKALALDSQRLKRLRENNGGWRYLDWLQYEKAARKSLPHELILWFCENKLKVADLMFILDRMNPLQIQHYIQRQRKKFRSAQEVVTTWDDYLSMAKRLKMNVNDEIIYRVRKLRQRHDELVQRCKEKAPEFYAEEVSEKYPHVNAICQSLKGKYEYANEIFAVVAPSSILDIVNDGRALNHCSGNSERYFERIERRESYVLFLRKTADTQKPYYTLEVEPNGTVRQKRTEFDRQNPDIEEATNFLREWQQVIAERLTEEDERLAHKSKVLRVQEFVELREKRAIIRTGDLAGKLLVDVLTADLMEAAA